MRRYYVVLAYDDDYCGGTFLDSVYVVRGKSTADKIVRELGASRTEVVLLSEWLAKYKGKVRITDDWKYGVVVYEE